tara:strand:+ start:661 stop:1962 length:1302 start_codon:yes stop_codon:yes gene_type:complete
VLEEGLQKLKEKKILDSLNIFNKLNKLYPNNSDILFCLGNVYYELNDLNKSLFYFEQSYKTHPNSEVIINNYAVTMQSLGRIKEAKKFFYKLIEINPENIKAYYRLFRMNVDILKNYSIKKLKNFENKKEISLEDKSLINYILSKYEKNNNNIKKEIQFLNKAHEYNFKSRVKYNSRLSYFYINILSQYYDKFQFLSKLQKYNQSSKLKPIFIIGLPRSGSTIIESLLSQNNEKFYSFGECGIFHNSIFNQIKNKPFNEKSKIEINGKELIESLKYVYDYSKKKNFIDKSLENFFYIDLILKIFPNAKFIHTFRNKSDAAIAIYQSMLIYLPWAHSIKNILDYILNYEKIISHFNAKYSKKILNLNFEDFTSNPETSSKKIFDFCDLEWNENALNFYNKNISSKSSSFLQIRKKIQKYDNEKYKSYYYLIKNN